MWWPFSIPPPHDAQMRVQLSPHSAAINPSLPSRPQSYFYPPANDSAHAPASAAATSPKSDTTSSPSSPNKAQSYAFPSAPVSTQPRAQSYAYTPPPAQKTTSPESASPEVRQEGFLSGRALKQFSFLAFGATCMALSVLVTRRSLSRKYLSIKPAGLFSPSNSVKEYPGSLDAAEALGLATLNVTSFGVMAVGMGMVAFDISSVDDLRTKVRRSMGTDGDEEIDQKLEEDIEEWMATVLARAQGKNDKSISDMMKEIGDLTQRAEESAQLAKAEKEAAKKNP